MKQVHETQPVGEATGDLPADAIVADTYGAGGIPVPFDLILEETGSGPCQASRSSREEVTKVVS
jgi:hypothetical protein